jgi:hypothetical protein
MHVYEEMVWNLFCLGEISEEEVSYYLGDIVRSYSFLEVK